MGNRFYEQQRNSTGDCPGNKNTKRRRKSVTWTDDKRDEAKELYLAANPTPETSVEIVKEIADELGENVNGVRMILSKAGVYIRKSTSVSDAPSKSKSTRVSKDAAHEGLRNAITDVGQVPDEEIITKLTGKAAIYLTTVINSTIATES